MEDQLQLETQFKAVLAALLTVCAPLVPRPLGSSFVMNGHRTPPPSAPIDIPSAQICAPGDRIDIASAETEERRGGSDGGVDTVDVRDLLEYPSGAVFPISVPSPRSHGDYSESSAPEHRAPPQAGETTPSAAPAGGLANTSSARGGAAPDHPHIISTDERQAPQAPGSRAVFTLPLGGDTPMPNNMTGSIVWLAIPTARSGLVSSDQETDHGVSGTWSGTPLGIGGSAARYGGPFPRFIRPGVFGCWVGARVISIVMKLDNIGVWLDEFGVARGKAGYGVTGEWNGAVNFEWECSWLQAGIFGESALLGGTDGEAENSGSEGRPCFVPSQR